MNDHRELSLKRLATWEVTIWLCIILAAFVITGCMSPNVRPAAEKLSSSTHEVADVWKDAIADGSVDAAEIKAVTRAVNHAERDAGFLDGALAEPPISIPATGIPWLDALTKLGEVAGAAWVAHQTVNYSRDKKRRERGEPVTVAEMITNRTGTPKDPANPQG